MEKALKMKETGVFCLAALTQCLLRRKHIEIPQKPGRTVISKIDSKAKSGYYIVDSI